MPKALKSTMSIPKGYGSVEVRADTLSEEDRTVEVCWATEAPVKRYSYDEGYYMEVLAIDDKAIRMDRFAAGMSLLDSHDNWSMDSRLGTVVPGSVFMKGKKAYARIKISKKARGEELYQDLKDGHAVMISVGYKIHQYEMTEGKNGGLPVLRATDWEPMEVSAVPIPADPGAYSRSERSSDEYECVLIRQESINAADAVTEKVTPMNKREAAKSYNGDQLAALALGAGISRSEGETDDALRIRLLAAYDAQERAEADEQARLAALEGTRQQEQENRSNPAIVPAVTPAPGVTQADVAEASRSAVANERKRQREIEALARSANVAIDDPMVRTHLDEGHSVEVFRTALLGNLIEKEQRSPTFPHASTRGMQDQTETTRKLVANAILHRHGVVTKLEDGANEYRSMSALDIAKDLLHQRGENTRGSVHEVMARALHTTSDFPIILGEVTRQTLMAGYTSYENTFQLFANHMVLTDFREVKALDMGAAPDLEKVNESGEFKRGTVRESEEGMKLASYGKIIGLTRQMLINDQLGAFTQLISGWGRKVAKLEGDIVWDVIINNAKLKNGKGLFHVDHKNLGTASVLDQAALEAARTQFRKQKDIDGEAINVTPKFLFVGSDLEISAQKLLTGITTPHTVAEVVPEAIRSLTPVYEHRLDNIATKAWFLFAEAANTMGRGIHYLHLAGQEQPRYEERLGFDVDGIEYKIAHDFGAGLTDYRFAYKNAGV